MAVSEHLVALQGNELWKAWWSWGIPVAWITSALVLAAEQSHSGELHTLGNLLDVARLAVYWFWCRLAWKCSASARNPGWKLLSKAALAAGFVLTVLT
jgi:hypothetical protein